MKIFTPDGELLEQWEIDGGENFLDFSPQYMAIDSH
jgi:hypothetical protein